MLMPVTYSHHFHCGIMSHFVTISHRILPNLAPFYNLPAQPLMLFIASVLSVHRDRAAAFTQMVLMLTH